MKGKNVCLAQEQKFLKHKGAKKGKSKGKEEEEEEEDFSKHSPEYDYLEAKDAEAARKETEGGSSSVDSVDPHFQRGTAAAREQK